MAAQNEKHECPECKRFEKRIAKPEARIAKLEKNSSNSSKPPSSDVAKPGGPQKKTKKKRKRGVQPGHGRHQTWGYLAIAGQHIYAYVAWSYSPLAGSAGSTARQVRAES